MSDFFAEYSHILIISFWRHHDVDKKKLELKKQIENLLRNDMKREVHISDEKFKIYCVLI